MISMTGQWQTDTILHGVAWFAQAFNLVYSCGVGKQKESKCMSHDGLSKAKWVCQPTHSQCKHWFAKVDGVQ